MLRPGAEVLGLDQLAEALLPLRVLQRTLEVGVVGILVVVATFVVLYVAGTTFRNG